jgi:hypothetical protein
MRNTLLATMLLSQLILGTQASQREIELFAATFEKQLQAARYMEKSCAPVQLVGWEGDATYRCSYTVRDSRTGRKKDGLVVMLNPTANQLSSWILNGCAAASPNEILAKCARRLLHRVMKESGGQFPVSGVVYEDIMPKDGIYEAYGFASGVTAVLEGVQHRREKPFEADELEIALRAMPMKTASQAGFARLVSVTRAEYRAVQPSTNVDGLRWLMVVRDEHRKAMRGTRNALFEAWLAANPR